MGRTRMGWIRMLFVWIALAMFLPPAGAAAQNNPPRRWREPPSVWACLDLTPAQTREIRKLRESLERAVGPLKLRGMERKAELKLLWMQLTPDRDAILAKEREIADLKWRIHEKRIEFRLRFRDVLTDDQLSEYLVVVGEMKDVPAPLLPGGRGRPPGPDRRRLPPPPAPW